MPHHALRAATDAPPAAVAPAILRSHAPALLTPALFGRAAGMCVYIATWQAAVKAPMPFGKQPMLLQFCRTELLMGLVEGVPQHEMESYLTNMEGFDWKACNHHRGS